MPTYRITAPDGRTFDVQGDGTAEEALAAFQAQYKPATDDSAWRGFVLGAMKPLDNAAQALAAALPAGVSGAIDAAGQAMGMPVVGEAVLANQAAREANSADASQLAGNIVGTLPTLVLPGGPLAQGAVGGALLTDETTPGGVATDAAKGAIGNKIGDVGMKAIGSAVAPTMSNVSQYLTGLGVPLTLGQIVGNSGTLAGRITKSMEDKFAGTFPGLGDAINQARARGIDGFNRAAVNEVLAPIGVTIPKDVAPGHAAVQFAKDTFNKAYDGILGRMHVALDDGLATRVDELANEAAALPGDMARTFKAIIAKHVDPRFDKASGVMTGRDLKLVDRDLRAKIKTYRGSSVAADREFADVLESLKASILDAAGRASGAGLRDALRLTDEAYRNFVVLRRASQSAAARGGVFTPNQLMTAVRATDTSVGKGATATGTAPMQRLATAASDTLPSDVPDSGTGGRWFANAAVPAMLGAGAVISPGAALGTAGVAGLGALPYLRGGQKAVEKLFQPGVARKATRKAIEAIPGGTAVSAWLLGND